MARQREKFRIRNKASVIEALIEKFGTLEEFCKQCGLDYELTLHGFTGVNWADIDLIESLRESGIHVEIAE